MRAIWAGAPFVWQFYPQDDGAHHAKCEAFLEHYLGQVDAPWGRACRQLWHAWNGAAAWAGWPSDDEAAAWRLHALAWRDRLAAQCDLCTQLIGFVHEKQ